MSAHRVLSLGAGVARGDTAQRLERAVASHVEIGAHQHGEPFRLIRCWRKWWGRRITTACCCGRPPDGTPVPSG